MPFFIYLYLTTFVVFPFLAYLVAKWSRFKTIVRSFKFILPFFLIHNILYVCGISLRGDNTDYMVFSLEYFLLCLISMRLYQSEDTFYKAIAGVGIFCFILGIMHVAFGFFIIIVSFHDYEPDKIYNFSYQEKTYTSRRYSFGFATLLDTSYRYDTYRNISYTPFELLIDSSRFWDLKSKVKLNDNSFNIEIDWLNDCPFLIFTSNNSEKIRIKLNRL